MAAHNNGGNTTVLEGIMEIGWDSINMSETALESVSQAVSISLLWKTNG